VRVGRYRRGKVGYVMRPETVPELPPIRWRRLALALGFGFLFFTLLDVARHRSLEDAARHGALATGFFLAMWCVIEVGLRLMIRRRRRP
jgi:hypothetical protein